MAHQQIFEGGCNDGDRNEKLDHGHRQRQRTRDCEGEGDRVPDREGRNYPQQFAPIPEPVNRRECQQEEDMIRSLRVSNMAKSEFRKRKKLRQEFNFLSGATSMWRVPAEGASDESAD